MSDDERYEPTIKEIQEVSAAVSVELGRLQDKIEEIELQRPEYTVEPNLHERNDKPRG